MSQGTSFPRFSVLALGALSSMAMTHAARGAFASKVVSYNPTVGRADYRNAQAALGLPDDFTGESPLQFPSIISPFNPPFQPDEIVQVGEGGHLTLELSHFAVPGAGPEIGIFTNLGLIDADFPNGQNTNPASTFNIRRTIQVEVSRDGETFVSAGSVVQEHPTLFYVNAGPFDESVPANPQLANFDLPFAGTFASFDGKNFAQTLAVFETPLGHSAGGTWLDISGTGLDRVGWIRLTMPDDLDGGIDAFNIDAVSVARGAVGSAVPEPGCAAILVSVLIGMARRRRVRAR